MHELPIVQSILDKVLEYAFKNKANRVTKVNLTLGEFVGFVDESIMFYWEEIAKNTLAADAKVIIKRKLGNIKCTKCHRTIKNKELNSCPYCHSYMLQMIGGDELIIKSIEIE